MGLLDILRSKPAKAPGLPTGSFTIDKNCRILTSTLPSSFPKEQITVIGQVVLDAFREGQDKQHPFQEINITFEKMTVRARDMRGGAIIFLAPQKAADKG